MASPALERRIVLALALFAVAVGIVARSAHLERKLFWQDESATALRVSGHAYADLYPLFDGKPRPIADVRRLTQRDPATNVTTVVRTIAAEDPHHAPLFYAFDRLALDAIGTDSATTYRLPSVIFGCLAIGFAFLLGTALYGSRLAGAVLAALVAVSPLHVLYARQAREYALFTCITSAASFLFVRALEGRGAMRWIAYACSVALGVYTDPIFGLVIAAHAVCAVAQLRATPQNLGAYGLATLAGLATFAPWALNAVRSHDSIQGQLDWGASVFPLKFLAEKWAFNVAAVFFDAEFADLRLSTIAAVILAFVAVACVVFIREANARARAFALPLTFVPIAFFVSLDIARGSHFSTIPRYLTAGWIGLDVVIAGTLFVGLTKRPGLSIAALACLIVAGTWSAVIDNRAENWWDNNNQVAYQSVARTIDEARAPLVLDDGLNEVALMLARYVRPDATLVLFREPATPVLPAATAHAFLVVPTSRFLTAIEARDGGAYTIRNVSPHVTNSISDFHTQLSRDPSFARSDETAERPANALWSLSPR